MLENDDVYGLQEPIVTNRSDNSCRSYIFNQRSKSHRVFLGGCKQSHDYLENSNSQKRRVTDQARLMKIKNFPSCFLQDKSPPKNCYTERRDQKTFSVDRVESRRQRRAYNLSKESLPSNIQKINKFPKRYMSEGRHDKKLLARSRSQRQIPSMHLKHSGFESCAQSPTMKRFGDSRNLCVQFQGSSHKSVKSNFNFVEMNSVCTNNQNPFEINSSIASVRLQSIEKQEDDTSFFNGNEAWPRKYSHINKLAKGLAVNMMEDIPFQMAGLEKIPLRPSISHKLKSLKLRDKNSTPGETCELEPRGLLRSKSDLFQKLHEAKIMFPLREGSEVGIKAKLNFKKNKLKVEESKHKVKLQPCDNSRRKINRQLIQFNQSKLKRCQKTKKKRIKSAVRPRIIIDASAISRPGSASKDAKLVRHHSQGCKAETTNDNSKPKMTKCMSLKDSAGLAICKKKRGAIHNRNAKNDSNFKRLKLMKKPDPQNVSNLENYLNRIETNEEPKNDKESKEANSTSQRSKRSILINQNHYLHNIHLLPQRDDSLRVRDKAEQQLNEEFMALQRCIDQIPDQEELSLDLEEENHTNRLRKISTTEVRKQCSLDVKQDSSSLPTERTSEVTTENCSELKDQRSLKYQNSTLSNSQLAQYKIPALSLKTKKTIRNAENPFKQKQSTNASSGHEHSYDNEDSPKAATGPMNVTFGK
ncbi:unnamed protein product [Moneuplotes crassus]|uniref:Uncharacterized protein n=1 Tax=Euplotes crassus TaxID=5936 RepID=A0AAD2DAK6_EUPCR|nr:unnamed protein product [Moneuplotes crassus]